MKAGTINIELSLDDSQFSVKVKEAGNTLQTLSQNLNTSGGSARNFEQALSSARSSLVSFGVGASAAVFGIHALSEALIAVPKHIIESAGEIERLQVLMKGLSTAPTDVLKAEDAKKNVQWALNLAQQAPFTLKALTEGMTRFKAGGLDPMDGSFQALVDSVAKFGGSSVILERASIAIQQMAGKGVVSMEELRQQLGEAVPDAINDMARGLGVSMQELTKLIGKGQVEAKDALARMFTVMAMQNSGAAADMMNTWKGLTEKLKDQWMIFAHDVGESGYLDAAKQALKDFMEGMGDEHFKKNFAFELSQALVTLIHTLQDATHFVMDHAEAIKVAGELYLVYFATNKFQAMTGGVVEFWNGMRSVVMGNVAQIKGSIAAGDAAYMESALVHQRAMQKMVANEAELTAAEQVANTRRLANGRFATNAYIELVQARINKLKEEQAMLLATAEKEALAADGTKALTTAINLMEGPVGWLITALGLIAFGFNTFGDSAQQAGEKALETFRAVDQGYSDMAEKKKLHEIADDAQGRVDSIGANANGSNNSWALQGTRQAEDVNGNMVPYQQAIDSWKKRRDEALGRLTQADQNITANDAKSGTASFINAMTNQMRAARIEHNNEIEKVKETNDKVLDHLKNDNAAFSTESHQQQVDLDNRDANWMRSQVSVLRSTRKAMNDAMSQKGISDKDKQTYQGNIDWLDQQIKSTESTVKSLEHLKDPIKLMQTKVPKPPAMRGDDALNSAITSNKGEIAKLTAQMKGNLHELTDAEALKEAVNGKIDALVKGGKYDNTDAKTGKKTPPNPKLVQQLRDTELQKEQLQAYVKMARDNDKEIRNLANERGLLNAQIENDYVPINTVLEKFDQEWRKKEKSNPKLTSDVNFQAQKAAAQASTFESEAMKMNIKDEGELRKINIALLDSEREKKEATFKLSLQEQAVELQNLMTWARTHHTMDAALNDEIAQRKQLISLEIEQQNRALESPMATLARGWKSGMDQMNQETAKWGNSVIDTIMKIVQTGKFNFADLTQSILADILKIKLEQQMGGMLNQATAGFGNYVGNLLGLNGGSINSGTQFNMGQFNFTPYAFANGGIMTQYGAMELRKYANGGIANRPQMALYGEAGPEAYVPLPDGRSIPVTMAGGQQGVVVNVINQSGQPVDAQSGQPRYNGDQLILDVVLTAMNQPGSFRDGMRNASK